MTRTLLAGAAGVVVGVLALAAFRFVAAAPEPVTHHHANLAIFVEGQRLDLSADHFMEDVSACVSDPSNVAPTSRVHLHNNDPDVVHVHHAGATWGHLLANLRMVLGDRLLATRDGTVHRAGEGRTLKFILNGRPEFSVYNEVIDSGDRLLISFGPESEQAVVDGQFPQVASNAEEFNRMPDPAGCGGAVAPTFGERVRDAFLG